MSKSDSLDDYLDAAREAALRAAVVLEDWRQRFEVREKGRCDLVTDADVASQRTIAEYLAGRYPSHAFLGEEDGTTNYVHDCPFYAVSIGLQVAGELVVGVVYDPPHKEMFAAAKGRGAWLTDRRLRVSGTGELVQALLATGFPADMRGQERALDWWRYFSLRAQSLRRTGSTALNLAYVAAGRFDGYFAFDNHVWDVAGAVVLLREAGGTVTNVDGSEYDPYTADALASNGALHPAMLECLRTGP